MSCGVGCRCVLDLMLLWLWCRPAAKAPIQSLAWELPYASGVDVKRKEKKKTNLYFNANFKRNETIISLFSFSFFFFLFATSWATPAAYGGG